MTLQEILALEDVATKIAYLKKGRKTCLPNRERLYNDWNPKNHEIMVDKVKYPDFSIQVEPEKTEYDKETDKVIVIPAKFKNIEVNRISLPIEQDIVNIQTAFTVGLEPEMDCVPQTQQEDDLLDTLKILLKKNKIKYQNKKIVRSWLSEQECAEYWYAVKDKGLWAKIMSKLKRIIGKSQPEYTLRSVVWSPFRGDKLYPFFDDKDDLIAFSREYKREDLDGNEVSCFTTITDTTVYNWELSSSYKETSFLHRFNKLPVIYCYRPEAFCEKIRPIRIRLEKLISSYADCIDYHFFPILKLYGDVANVSGGFKNRVAQLQGEGADAQYLTWEQASETVKLELESLTEKAYSLTNTPRIMPENLKAIGGSFSGVSFRYMFMGAHLSVSNHAEVIGDFMQRRVNFLVHALGKINTSMENATETIEINVELQPYMIDSLTDKVATAVQAVNGGIWSRREGIVFAGNQDRLEEELKEIEGNQEEP